MMSGTSLDGVDIAFCEFLVDEDVWTYRIHCAETVPYDKQWIKTLGNLENSSALNFAIIHKQYGHLIGHMISDFINKHKLTPDFIASHGHTIFHQPANKLTFQIGDGAAIAAEVGFPVVCDFRSLDVALGGQGAPLVPIGDKLLFGSYDYCLNLGGFANISFDKNNTRVAFDICPVNMVLNKIAAILGKDYDHNGEIAASGNINADLLKALNSLDYYKSPFPKSLGKEWVVKFFDPVVDTFNIAESEKLCTLCEHIALQIAGSDKMKAGKKMLITGGGTYNSFLISRIKEHCNCEIIIPDKLTIEYKEALIFAFLGMLRIEEKANCLHSVTGAIKDNIGGAVYLGK